MTDAGRPRSTAIPAIRRLDALGELESGDRALLELAADRPAHVRAHRELVAAGQSLAAPMLILEGWAAHVRIMPDGRRQIISLVLPGEIVGNRGPDRPRATATVLAVTNLATCRLPQHTSARLDRAYATSRTLDESYLMAQVVRLGRLDAAERIIDLLVEVYERLEIAGLGEEGRFVFPLTQEMLADTVGLTSVHVNRVVQQARQRGELVWTGRSVHLTDVGQSRRSVGRPDRLAGG